MRVSSIRKVKLILPALTEAKSPFWRPIKYSLFPPLGLATLAAYLDDTDEVEIQDEHVETLNVKDEPDLVVSVVIPCLNEAGNIEKCVRTALGVLEESGIDGEVVVADNASEDDSAELAAAAGARDANRRRDGGRAARVGPPLGALHRAAERARQRRHRW